MPNPNPDTSGIEGHKFLPGQSGNPSGLPKENITYFINKYLDMPIKDMLELYADKERREALPAKEAIALTQVARAIEGKDYPTDRVIDRTEGKATETVVVIGAERLAEIEAAVKSIAGIKQQNAPSEPGTSPEVV